MSRNATSVCQIYFIWSILRISISTMDSNMSKYIINCWPNFILILVLHITYWCGSSLKMIHNGLKHVGGIIF